MKSCGSGTRRKGREGPFTLWLCALGWLVAPVGSAAPADFAILPVRTLTNRVLIEYPSEPASYFILYHGTTVRSIAQPVFVALSPPAGTGSMVHVFDPGTSGFLRLARIAQSSATDVDGDGIDDVYELRHPRCLDPLNAADAAEDFDSDGESNLDEFRSGTDPEDGLAGATTVFVVDDPPAASTTHFHTLTQAVTHLTATLPTGSPGRVLIATTREQRIDELDLRGSLSIATAEGFQGRATLIGPGSSPLVIRASDAFPLTGFNIRNTAGLRLEAGRSIALSQNRLPATSILIGSSAATQGPTGGSKATRQPNGGGGGSASVSDCVFSGPLTLAWFGSVGTEAELVITRNSATAIHASVGGTFGGQARIVGNLSPEVSLTFDALAGAQVLLSEMANLEQLTFSGTAAANPTLEFSGIMAGLVTLNLNGVGSVFAGIEMMTTDRLTLNVGAAETDLDVRDVTADEIVVNLQSPTQGFGTFRHRQDHVTAIGGIRIDAWNAEHAEADVSLSLVNASTLELRTRALTRLELADGITLTGSLNASVASEILEIQAVQARVEGGIQINASGVGAGVYGFWQGGQIRGGAAFDCAHGVVVGITIDSTLFEGGGALSIVPNARDAPYARTDASSAVPGRPRPVGQGDAAIVLRNLEQAPSSVLIAGMDSPVTIEGCTFHASGSTPAVVLDDVRGAIRVAKCTFHGQGLGIAEAQADVTVEGNQFLVDGTLFPALGISGRSATVLDNILTGAGLSGLALTLSGTGTVRKTQIVGGLGLTLGDGEILLDEVSTQGMTTITGGRIQARKVAFSDLLSVMGDGLVGFEDCALGGITLLDLTETGGLLVDPVTLGASPDAVYSSIDFDNDDLHCADYPPPQVRPDTGTCVREGVSPPR